MSVILVNAEAGRVPLPDGVVHCSVSSPPYFSLRAYEGDQARDWPEVSYAPMPGLPKMTIPAMHCALGHEETPEAFIGHLVACYREVKRVLRDDGGCWVVIGDSYVSHKPRGKAIHHQSSDFGDQTPAFLAAQQAIDFRGKGFNDGNLMLIPHRLALALQADGWTVRNDCVFAKVAPMPESVQGTRWTRCRVKAKSRGQRENTLQTRGDGCVKHGETISNSEQAQYTDCPGCPRCEAHGGYVLRRGSWRHTRAHEVVLHLSKGMGYFSDQEAVREVHWYQRPEYQQKYAAQIAQHIRRPMTLQGSGETASVKHNEEYEDNRLHESSSGRNPRSVLTPKGDGGYQGAHYATFPANLIRPLIKSSCPVRCCPACGAGWAPRVEKERSFESGSGKAGNRPNGKYKDWEGTGLIGNDLRMGPTVSTTILDYRPTCTCHAGNPDPPHAPGVVLDPFFGSGTTGLVARELGVDCIGLDLSYDYLHDQARARLELDAWDAWHQGRDGDVVGDLEGLPLFEGIG